MSVFSIKSAMLFALVMMCLSSVQAATVKLGQHVFYTPAKAAKDKRLLVVEQGLAERMAPNAATFTKAGHAVLEVAGLRGRGDFAGTMTAAVQHLAKNKATAEWAKVPRILLGFSANGPRSAQLVYDNVKDWSGLMLVNSATTAAHLPGKNASTAQKSLPLLILYGDKDPISPAVRGKSLIAAAKKQSLAVTSKEISSADHFGPFKLADGQACMLSFLKTCK